jgi:antitoxin ChpS
MNRHTDPDTARAAQLFIERIKAVYPLKSAILFGSRARGEFQPYSDADIAVLLQGSPGKFLAVKLAMADIAYDVLLETGIRIQAFPIWEEQWEHPQDYSNPRLLENIAREGIPL